MALVDARDLHKNYRDGATIVQAVNGVSFSIEPGSLVSFVGPSGSGKSTLLNMIGCLDRPSNGSLTVAGQDVSRLTSRESARFRGHHIGFIFQDFNLLPVLTVYENIEYPLLMVQNRPPDQRRRQVETVLAAVGMTDQGHKYPQQISGGQKQRVAVARALVSQPQLVLADEPTANLDKVTALQIIALMKRMRDDFGTTFIFSTHDPKIVGTAEVVLTLEDGRLLSAREHGGTP